MNCNGFSLIDDVARGGRRRLGRREAGRVKTIINYYFNFCEVRNNTTEGAIDILWGLNVKTSWYTIHFSNWRAVHASLITKYVLLLSILTLFYLFFFIHLSVSAVSVEKAESWSTLLTLERVVKQSSPAPEQYNMSQRSNASKKESILELTKMIDSSVRVKCLGGRELKGILRGYDELVNLVLDDADEFLRGEFSFR